MLIGKGNDLEKLLNERVELLKQDAKQKDDMIDEIATITVSEVYQLKANEKEVQTKKKASA